MDARTSVWHILQYSDTLDLQLATELARDRHVTLWEPDRSVLPLRPRFQERERVVPGSTLCIRTFPLMRGFARAPMSRLARTGPQLTRRLKHRSPVPAEATLVCTTPYFAPVAERWPGPVVYWLTDLMIHYDGAQRDTLVQLDRRMCAAATLVCPASNRIASYLQREAMCPPVKIHVLPNAARPASLLSEPLHRPAPVADFAAGWKPQGHGPVAGVLGNLSENMDWAFLRNLLDLTPWLEWMFVGPSRRPAEDPRQGEAYDVVRHHPSTTFLGAKPYEELARYARAVSVAVLPYRRREPTYSGSSTRFYEHLAAGHPILGTPNVEELRHKGPLLQLVATAGEAAEALERLRANGWEDGQRTARWEASLENTWQTRAESMREALQGRLQFASQPVPVSAGRLQECV